MKTNLKTIALVTMMAFQAEAASLMPAAKMKLKSIDQKVDFSQVTADLQIDCTYEEPSIYKPVTQSCGKQIIPLKIDSDHNVLIPAVEKFKNSQGQKINNYSLSVTIYEMNTPIVGLWPKSINDIDLNGVVINLVKIKKSTFDVTIDQRSIFDSNLILHPQAVLYVSFYEDVGDKDSKVKITSAANSLRGYSRDNKSRSYKTEPLLKDMNKVEMNELTFAFLQNDKKHVDLKITFFTGSENYQSVKKLKLSYDMLSEIDSVELK